MGQTEKDLHPPSTAGQPLKPEMFYGTGRHSQGVRSADRSPAQPKGSICNPWPLFRRGEEPSPEAVAKPEAAVGKVSVDSPSCSRTSLPVNAVCPFRKLLR